jgi:hypothetical protein
MKGYWNYFRTTFGPVTHLFDPVIFFLYCLVGTPKNFLNEVEKLLESS